MPLISFAIWGTAPRYVVGAERNAQLARDVYPGWRCRFYCAASVPPAALEALAAFPHVDVVRRDEPGDWRGLFWRFEAASDGDGPVIFRDADSRLNERERAAVDAWLSSDRDVHVMRDHPAHNVPILGGMWGVRGQRRAEFAALLASHPRGAYWQADQEFLAAVVAPRVRGCWLEHDEYFAGHAFPTRRRGRQFVGQPFDELERPLIDGPTAFERRVRHVTRRLRHAASRSWKGVLAR